MIHTDIYGVEESRKQMVRSRESETTTLVVLFGALIAFMISSAILVLLFR